MWVPYDVDEIEVSEIFDLGPSEILAPVAPGVSQGTKICVSKISSYDPKMMFYGFVLPKMSKS